MLRDNARPILIMEQWIEDLITGLTLEFSFNANDGTSKLTLRGECLPCGNRDIIFNTEGQMAGAGTSV